MSDTTASLDDGVGYRDGTDAPGPNSGKNLVQSSVRAASERRQRRAVAGIVVGFSLLVAVCFVAGTLAWQSNEATRTVVRALDVRRASSNAMETLLRAETAQRAFLLTHDATFLPEYEAAVSEVPSRQALLERAARFDREHGQMAELFNRLAMAKIEELKATVALGRAGRWDDALVVVRTGDGRRTMRQAQTVLDDLAASLDREVAASAPWQARLSKVLLVTIGLAAVCVTALSLVVFRDTRRNLRFLVARENALRALTHTLEDRVRRRTSSLLLANQRFDAALQAARVTVFTQDRDLRFTWVSTADPDLTAADIIGRANDEVLPEQDSEAVLTVKRRVIETGEPGHAEVRIAQNGKEKWYDLSVRPLVDDDGVVTGLIGGSIDITARKQQEAQIRLLMREVTHRSKNLLSVIQAIMRQTAANSSSTADFERRFTDRLHSLAGSHDLLVDENWTGASLRDLVHSQLGHYADLVGSQVALSGPPLQLAPDAAQHIGMALHELATNAAKYGALSTPDGVVRISWTGPEPIPGAPADRVDLRCRLSWEEEGGPPVTPPTRRGFGRVVIERTVARALSGEVDVSYPVTGVRWELSFPPSALV